MSHFFLIGGFIGFALTFFTAFWAGASVHIALRNGMIGCLIMAFLLRFFALRLMRLVVETKLRELDRLEAQQEDEE